MKKKILLFFCCLIFFCGLSVLSDRAIGFFIPRQEQGDGLIFPRNARHQFRTPEFSFTVETNSLGFRDREFDLRRTAKIRVLAVGDSFTYGWGVEASQSWPKILEEKLRAAGHDLEIGNLGKPAGSPRDYADIAEKAIPMLKPDMLVVGVLQGDDLAQMALPIQSPSSENANKKPPGEISLRRSLQSIANWMYPNYLGLMSARVKPGSALADQWKQDAQTFLRVMKPEEKTRYEKLDAKVRDAFLNGDLNPALIYLSLSQPQYFLQTLDVNSPKVRSLVEEMSKQLVRIKNAARQNNAEVVVVSVPYGIYVSPASFKSRQRLGFSVVPEMLTTNAEDELIRDAAQMAGLPFYDLTREFRQASLHTDFFFELDGHFNSAGHRYFAEGLAPIIEKTISPLSVR